MGSALRHTEGSFAILSYWHADKHLPDDNVELGKFNKFHRPASVVGEAALYVQAGAPPVFVHL